MTHKPPAVPDGTSKSTSSGWSSSFDVEELELGSGRFCETTSERGEAAPSVLLPEGKESKVMPVRTRLNRSNIMIMNVKAKTGSV